ncbi:MAG: hypothetical protein ACXABV_04275 [Candidatus Thorarchaeota archaeon]
MEIQSIDLISVATPLEVLFTVPIYIAARFLPDDRGRRMNGCIVAFLIWLFVTMGALMPFFAVKLPGTIELFIIVLFVMLTDIGFQFRTLKKEAKFVQIQEERFAVAGDVRLASA